ncbi:uncharacterized protein LOC128626673 isoform X2 [Artibeus jamaicensis]|uniref:uncharacterized protein LOC128626673 isoform X2 n=1 Tax=Artibeus jamaicensis TaxID=9417 RepID=UPI00235ABF28|nr:uncharacterized protein LOC128626673 isoform X2 [Artibeus jamaicensis]
MRLFSQRLNCGCGRQPPTTAGERGAWEQGLEPLPPQFQPLGGSVVSVTKRPRRALATCSGTCSFSPGEEFADSEPPCPLLIPWCPCRLSLRNQEGPQRRSSGQICWNQISTRRYFLEYEPLGGDLGTWPRLCLFRNSFLFAHQYFIFWKVSAGWQFAGEQRHLVSALRTCAQAQPLLPRRTPRHLGGKAHLLFAVGHRPDRAPSVTVLRVHSLYGQVRVSSPPQGNGLGGHIRTSDPGTPPTWGLGQGSKDAGLSGTLPDQPSSSVPFPSLLRERETLEQREEKQQGKSVHLVNNT